MPTFTPSSDEVRLYETVVLLPVTLSEKELKEATSEVEDIFTERGGKKLHKDEWGRQGLAYPIRKHREGQYIVYLFELAPSSLSSVDAALRLEKNVLRHLVVKVPKNYEVSTFAERFDAWEKDQERAKEQEEKDREEAVKQKLAKRPVCAAPPPAAPSTPADGASIEEKLGEIISDEDLKL
jgi:small subunit ribosomal protein S6